MSIEIEDERLWRLERQALVAGEQGCPAERSVFGKQRIERVDTGRIERVERFVEQPQRRVERQRESRKRDPPALALTQCANRRVAAGAHAEPLPQAITSTTLPSGVSSTFCTSAPTAAPPMTPTTAVVT